MKGGDYVEASQSPSETATVFGGSKWITFGGLGGERRVVRAEREKNIYGLKEEE